MNPVLECIQELEQKRLKATDSFSTLCQAGLPPTDISEALTEAETPQETQSNGDKSDVFEPLDEPRSIFCDVFSEDEEVEEEEEDVDEEEDGWVFFFQYPLCYFTMSDNTKLSNA